MAKRKRRRGLDEAGSCVANAVDFLLSNRRASARDIREANPCLTTAAAVDLWRLGKMEPSRKHLLSWAKSELGREHGLSGLRRPRKRK